MIADLENDGLVLLNTSGEAVPDQATIIILGVARSGTSMTANILHALGIFIGENYNKAVFEDYDMADAITGDRDTLCKLIARRNSMHKVWGFKCPNAYKMIEDKLDLFRNPRLVINIRDPLAIAKRNHISMRKDLIDSLQEAIDQLDILTQFIGKLSCPALLVSYEKAQSNTLAFLKLLCNFCGVDYTSVQPRKIQSIVQNGNELYLDAARIKLNDSELTFTNLSEGFEGRIDYMAGCILEGWIRKLNEPGIVEVIVKSDNEIIGHGLAEHYRSDLEHADKNGGYCAFRIRLARLVKFEDLTVIAKV